MKRKRHKLLEEPALARLIGATKDETHALRDEALLELLYGSALRVGEAVDLDVPGLDLEAAQATVTGKGRKTRTVPLTPLSLAALRRYLGPRQWGPLFLTQHGNRMNNRLIQRIVQKYAEKADLPHISPHTLRHSCTSHMLKRGAYLFSVQELLGHSHVTTTAVYCHELGVRPPLAQAHRLSHPRA